MVHLAGVLAAREYLETKCPLIIDSAFGRLDEFHFEGVISLIERVDDQVIVLDYQSNNARFYKKFSGGIGHVTTRSFGIET